MGFSLSDLLPGQLVLNPENEDIAQISDPLDITGNQYNFATDEINALNAAAQAEAEALNEERYGIATDLLSPYIEDSGTAREQLMVELGLAEGEAGTAYLDNPGYQTLLDEMSSGVDQASANSGSLYSGTRLEAAGEASGQVQQSYYNNYMSLLSNMASPQTATNLASMGLDQGIAMGNQDLGFQTIESNTLAGQRDADQARNADIAGFFSSLFGFGGGTSSGTSSGSSGGGFI